MICYDSNWKHSSYVEEEKHVPKKTEATVPLKEKLLETFTEMWTGGTFLAKIILKTMFFC